MTTKLYAIASALALTACATPEAPAQQNTQQNAPQNTSGPSSFTRAIHDQTRAERPFSDTRDFDFAQRGFIATRKDPLITTATGQPVWN
ncbi:MAG: hypothetical protein EOP61_17485, partial [Sphingomonadales bacterium]